MNDTVFDFRSEAIEASSKVLRTGADLPLDRSVCLPSDGESSQPFKWLGRFVLLRFIVGISLLAGGGVAAAKSKHQDEISPTMLVGIACSVGGISILISNAIFQRRFARRMIGPRYDDLAGFSTGFEPICVEVEDASSFDKLKLVSEDVGFLGLDSRNQRVIIEGVRCRYSIHASDVKQVEQIAGGSSSATQLTYQIGEVSLSIAIKSGSIWHEVRRQLGARQNPLIDEIRETLNL